VTRHQPDIVIFGHSHTYGDCRSNGVWYVNPGSTGPARFKLKRTAALLHLPEKDTGALPTLDRIELEGKAPPRLRTARVGQQADAAEAANADPQHLVQSGAGGRVKKRKHSSSTETC
jgi:Calcineurin-like phosphoesterase superfamily domain